MIVYDIDIRASTVTMYTVIALIDEQPSDFSVRLWWRSSEHSLLGHMQTPLQVLSLEAVVFHC